MKKELIPLKNENGQEESKRRTVKEENKEEEKFQKEKTLYQDEIPEGFDRVLWGDLMVMFNPDDEDEFWNSQQDWNIVSWKLHGSSGMLELKLESEEDSTMALELIRFVKKLLAELEPEDSDGDEEDL
ncbi:hypothetical protein Tco_0939814 [Tanacetum coccineum]|uniref:Uncharacterized protein n=1 Tax=Tanacetum coccineum TaxID=301880 RepID=A0ABQ5DLV3_9ASTR